MLPGNGAVANWLADFKIEVTTSSNEAFNNGRQQIEITLTATPLKDKTITEAQRKSLKVVFVNDDGEFESLPSHETSPDSDWSASRTRDENYDYFPGSSTAPSENGSALIRERVYIHTTARPNNKITLYASIQEEQDDPNTIYYTDPIMGPFHTTVDLYARASLTYRFPEDYIWRSTFTDGDIVGGSRFIYEFSLTPDNVRFAYAVFDSNDTQGMIRWQDHQPDQSFASHVGIALPGDAALHYDNDITLSDDFRSRMAQTVKSSVDGQLVVLIQGDNAIPFYRDGVNHGGPCTLTAYDRYGTGHSLIIAFDEAQPTPLKRRTTLTVASSPRQ